MASITNLFQVGPTPNNKAQQYAITSRKRRPVDPPGEEACNEKCYVSVASPTISPSGTFLTGQPVNKRIRTVDDSLEALSLRATDPPGYYSSQNQGGILSNNEKTYSNQSTHQMVDLQLQSNGATTSSTSTSTVAASNKRLDSNGTSNQNLPISKRMQMCRNLDQSSSGMTDTGNSEMSLEGSDIYSDDESLDSSSGSVSESSIQNSMYQVVFGRMKGSGSGGISNYDVVDAKIEDLIRRSRMEAVLKCKKEETVNDKGDDTENSMKSMELG
jgi:hypothetical protein